MEVGHNSRKSRYEIYFCGYAPVIPPVETTPSIVFFPEEGDWNDFGFKCRYQFFIFQKGKERREGHAFVGFIGEDGSLSKSDFSDSIIPANELPQFFTMQGEMSEYRTLVKEYGLSDSNSILVEINDLVALRTNRVQSHWYTSALSTDVFSLAFMRESGRHFAFNNADSILKGTESEDLGRISNSLQLTYSLPSFKSDNRISFEFDPKSILPKRINILIGRNGLGKSQALRSIVDSLQTGSGAFRDHKADRPKISRLLAIATPGETQNTFPPVKENTKIQYRRLKLQRTSRSDISEGFGELCVQLARSTETIGSLDRWSIFLESIAFLEDFESLVFRLNRKPVVRHNYTKSIRGNTYVSLPNLAKGGEQAALEAWSAIPRNAEPKKLLVEDIVPLSSGQISFLKFAVQACLYIENGTLVLLDEPETHLHPAYISKFIRLLNKLLKLTGSVAIVATHSPYFVREVPSAQVHVYKARGNENVDILAPRLPTFGADIGSISYFVFDDDITNALVEELISNLPEDPVGRVQAIDAYRHEISNEVFMHLQRELNIESNSEKD